jgi:acetylornithine deacetylase/succinyl-diaminopimelate desuccinylase-like protein
MMYGHFDKQPHMEGWLPGLSPINPVIKDGKLYGRGAADDGYAIFTAILSIKAL